MSSKRIERKLSVMTEAIMKLQPQKNFPIIRVIQIDHNKHAYIPANQQWEILSIVLNHVTGTETTVLIAKSAAGPSSSSLLFYYVEPAATASYVGNLDLKSSKLLMGEGFYAYISGAALCTLILTVLESPLSFNVALDKPQT